MSTGSNYPAGVYVLDMKTTNYIDGDPGLYHFIQESGRWKLNDSASKKEINTTFAGVNGLAANMTQAGAILMPGFIKAAYDKSKYDLSKLDREGLTLNYNPPSLYADGKHWTTPTQKKWSKQVAALDLAKQLVESQKRGKEVFWTIHGSGTELMHSAIKATGGYKLDKHTMVFLSPTCALSPVMADVKRSGINLHEDVMKISQDDLLSRNAQFGDGAALKRELDSMKGFEFKAAELAEENIADGFSYAGMAASVAGVAVGVGAFILAPAIPAITIGAVATAALGGYGTLDKIRALRNVSANKSTNPAVNPHLNPYKNRIQMSIHTKNASGGAGKSFIASVKALVGK